MSRVQALGINSKLRPGKLKVYGFSKEDSAAHFVVETEFGVIVLRSRTMVLVRNDWSLEQQSNYPVVSNLLN